MTTLEVERPVVLRQRRAGADGRVLLLHGLANSATVWQAFTEHDTGCATWTADLPWRGEGVAGWSHRGNLTDWIAEAIDAVPRQSAPPQSVPSQSAARQTPPTPGANPHREHAIEHAFGLASDYSTAMKRPGQRGPAGNERARSAGYDPARSAGYDLAGSAGYELAGSAGNELATDTWTSSRQPTSIGSQPAPITDLVVVAHSFSANLLLALLDREPTRRLAGIVLVSPFYRPNPDRFEWPDIARYLNDFHLIMEDGIRAQGGQRLSPGVRRELALRVRELVGPYGWTRFFQTYLDTPWLRLDRIQTPVLVLSGENDFAALPGEARALAAALPDARVRVLPDCGHFLMAERPQRFAAEITRFVHSLPVGETTR